MRRRDISKVLLLPAAAQAAARYALTESETAAHITAVNEEYPELHLERYGGGITQPAEKNADALSAAIRTAQTKGGGVIHAAALGAYNFTGSFVLPPYTTLQGGGYRTVLNYNGAGSFLTLSSKSSRSVLADLMLIGNSRQGTAVTLGDESGNVGFCRLERLLISGFAVALRMGGATWLTCQKCEFGNAAGGRGVVTNNIGIDFNYCSGKNYSSALTFIDCVVANNANAGVQASNVPVTMNEVVWLNCSVQNNCQGDVRNAQFHMGTVAGFTLDNLYMEYLLGGPPPDALRTDNLSCGQIRALYVDTAATGVIDRGGGSMGQVEILHPKIFGTTTAAINCRSEKDIVIRGASVDGSVTLTGAGCVYLASGSGLASWPRSEASFSPVLTPADGSIAQTQVGTWSQVGNVVTLTFRIDWRSRAGSGSLTIRGLPVAPKAGLPDVGLALGYFTGIANTGGQLAIYLAAGSTTASIVVCGSPATALQTAALASSGSLVVSGSYQV